MLNRVLWPGEYKVSSFFESNRNFYLILFAAMLVRSFPFGFVYFTFSDDHNAYGIFALFQENLWHDVVLRYELFGFRPLAGLTDAYIISRFWDNMAFVLLAVTALQFATILLLDSVFAKSGIMWGRAAAVFFAFFPALTESAYWINASSRIVTSAFFAALACFAVLKFIYKEAGHLFWLAVALLSGILAQGFYEQGAIFAFTLTFGILILHRKAIEHKVLFIWPFINLSMIITHYYIFRNVGYLSDRAEIAGADGLSLIPTIIARIGRAFVLEQAPTVINALRWGIAGLIADHLPLMIVIVLLSFVLACFAVVDGTLKRDASISVVWSIIAGLTLSLSTLSIFFILADAWIWVRNFYYTVIGLAILVQMAVNVLFYYRSNRAVMALKYTFAFAVVFVFISSFILEVDSLRKTDYYDRLIVSNMINEIDRLGTRNDQTVWLFGLRWNYERKINPRIVSSIREDWAINGHFGAATHRKAHERPWIVPVMNDQMTDIDFSDDVLLGLDIYFNVSALYFDGNYLVFVESGEVFGILDLADSGRFTIVRN